MKNPFGDCFLVSLVLKVCCSPYIALHFSDMADGGTLGSEPPGTPMEPISSVDARQCMPVQEVNELGAKVTIWLQSLRSRGHCIARVGF